MKLIAKKPLRYGGASLAVGDVFEAKPKHGKLLKVTGKASDAPVTVAVSKIEKIKPVSDENVSEAKADVVEVVEPKRTYQRRDMKAED